MRDMRLNSKCLMSFLLIYCSCFIGISRDRNTISFVGLSAEYPLPPNFRVKPDSCLFFEFSESVKNRIKLLPRIRRIVKFPKSNNIYQFSVPDSMILLTDQTKKFMLSPHFSLGNFYEKGYHNKKAILIDPLLVVKLEILYALLQKFNPKADVFISSGYRSLKENYKARNRTKYTMHQFGKAADIYICKKGHRGRYYIDLNGDKKSNKKDRWIVMFILWEIEKIFPELAGFNQIYRRHVHTDVRGKNHATMPKSFRSRKRLSRGRRYKKFLKQWPSFDRDEILNRPFFLNFIQNS